MKLHSSDPEVFFVAEDGARVRAIKVEDEFRTGILPGEFIAVRVEMETWDGKVAVVELDSPKHVFPGDALSVSIDDEIVSHRASRKLLTDEELDQQLQNAAAEVAEWNKKLNG